MELTLKPILPTITKMVLDQLRQQAPVKTGALQRSVTVQAVEDGDGFQIKTGFLTYGIFLDSGTKNYYNPNPTAPWRKSPPKGKGGIPPRYWTNLGQSTTTRIAMLIEKELAKLKLPIGEVS